MPGISTPDNLSGGAHGSAKIINRTMPVFLVALLIAALLASCSPAHEYAGTVIDPPSPAFDFAGTNWDNTAFRLSDLRDKVVVLFFGYTHCPDVCPITLASMRRLKELMGEQSRELAVVFVTVDPERDTVERLAQYIPAFDADFYGVRLDTETLEETKQYYHIYSEIVRDPESTDPDNYRVDHTGSSLVLDTLGQFRLLFSFGSDVEAMQSDIAYLLTHP